MMQVTRNQAIASVCRYSGLLPAEIIDLNLTDVDLDSSTLSVTGHKSANRVVRMTSDEKERIEEYLRSRPQCDSQALFLSYRCKRLSTRMIYKVVRDSYHNAASDCRISPRRLKHSLANQLLECGADTVQVQELLGQSAHGVYQAHRDLLKRQGRIKRCNYPKHRRRTRNRA